MCLKIIIFSIWFSLKNSLHLTEKLDLNHSKCSSRTIFTKLKLVQALLEKAKFYYDAKLEDKYIQLYMESLRSQDSAVD